MNTHRTHEREPQQRDMPKRGRHLGGDHARRTLMGGLLVTATLLGGLALTTTSASAVGPSFTDVPWTNDMNAESHWENEFGMECTKYEPHSGSIEAEYDAAVTKKGSDFVRVYRDLTNVGAFQATHPQGEPPMSWVMKCKNVPVQVPDPAKLRLTFIQECGVFTPLAGPWSPPAEVQFRLRNGNDAPVDYVLRQAGGGEIQSGKLPVGDTFVAFPFGARTLILDTYNAAGVKVHSETKAGGDTYLTTDDDGEKCLPTTPEPRIEFGDWVIGEYDCDDTTVEQTRGVTTTTYVWDGEKFVGTTEQTTETLPRDLRADEIEECSTPEPPIEEPPTQEPPPIEEPPIQEQPTVEPPIQEPIQNPTPVEPPTQEPPTVDALPPAPSTPTQVGQVPPTPAVVATELPATGSSTWNTFLLALAALGAGVAFLRLSRRPA